MLDAETKAFLDQLAADPPPSWEELGVTKSREAFAGFVDLVGVGADLPQVYDADTNGTPVRVYRGTSAESAPLILFIHGGGWVLGDLDSHDALCRNLAAGAGATVVAVDYPLAPEAKWPEPAEACYHALAWAADSALPLGSDASRLCVAGDSAGGHLALALCLMARDRQGPRIDKAALFYPVVSPRFDTASYSEFADGYGLTCEDMKWFWAQLLPEGESALKHVDALSEGSLSGLPETLIITAEHDVLRDEGEQLSRRMKADGVPTELTRVDGVMHGFVHLAGAFSKAAGALDEATAFLKKTSGPQHSKS